MLNKTYLNLDYFPPSSIMPLQGYNAKFSDTFDTFNNACQLDLK